MSTDSSNSPLTGGGGARLIPETSPGDVTSLTENLRENLAINNHDRGNNGAEDTSDSDDVFGSDTHGNVRSGNQIASGNGGTYAGTYVRPDSLQQANSIGSPLRPRQVQAGHRNNPDAFRFHLEQADHQMVSRQARDYPTRHHRGYPREEVDAQSRGPVTACVFIANLPYHIEDGLIRHEVEQIFRLFGEVFLKIRRDRNNLPFIFAQYTDDGDAARAFNNGQDIDILGRPCRVEFAKAARVSYYITARDGHSMTEAEAVQALMGVKVRSIEPLNHQIRQFLNLPGESFLIKFHDYKAGREMVSWYNGDSTYAVLLFNDEGQSRSQHCFRVPRCPEKDSRTIWISNLHGDIQSSEVHELAIDFGEISNIFIQPVSFQRAHGPSERAWAFVEFERPQSVDSAIEGLHNTPNPLDDGLLVVEAKRPKFDRQNRTPASGSQDRGTRHLCYDEEPQTPIRQHRRNQLVRTQGTPSQEPTEQLHAVRGPVTTSVDASPGGFPAPMPGMPGPLISGPFPGPGFPAPSPGFGYPMGPPPMTPHHGVTMPYTYGYQPVFSTPVYDPLQGWTPPGGFLLGGMPPSAMGQGPGGPGDQSEPASNVKN